ncbi:MAG: hypothetical protein ACJ764_05315 [Solirubrobacteraceae bacterium]
MIVPAHLGHWYSAFGFLIPAVLVVLWIRLQTRRERRRQEFAQYWTLELRGENWTLVSIEPAPVSRRQHRSRLVLVPPPWSAPDSAAAANEAELAPSAAMSNGHRQAP